MRLGRIALEAVDEPGLGGAEGEPVAPGLLQCDEELSATVHRFFVQFIFALELDLERVLAAHRTVRAPLAPDGDIRLCGVPMAEIQYSEVLKNFLDDGIKFKAEALPLKDQVGGYRMLFSHNTQFPVSQAPEGDRTSMTTLTRIFPALAPLKTSDTDRVELVNQTL